MADITTIPANLHYGTIDYPSVSANIFNITIGPDLSGVVTALSVGSDYFVINTDDYDAIVDVVYAPDTVLSATLSSYWNDNYFDGEIATTVNISFSAENGVLSALSIPVTGTFNGLEYPNNVTDPSGFAYASPQDHARLYVNGNI